MMKKVINRSLWITVFIIVMGLVVWSNIKRANSHCSDIQVSMRNTNYPTLISKETIRTNILEKMPAVVGQSLKNVDLEKLEDQVSINSQLSEVKAYLNLNGILNIKVTPRQAVLRIFDAKGQNLYLGKDQVLMNNSLYHTQRIIVASGHITFISNSDRKEVLQGNKELPQIYNDLYLLAMHIHDDEFLEALIDQIYVSKNQEIILTPKVGVKKIYFGEIEEIEDKLFKLKAFYTSGNKKVDWQKYQSINLKYRNQIVCSKK